MPTFISSDPQTTYLRLRRVAQRNGFQLVTVGRGNGQYVVVDPATAGTPVSPILNGLERVEAWLRVAAAERELEAARAALVAVR